MRTSAPYLRGWYQQQKAEQAEDARRRRQGLSAVVIAVALGVTAALVMDASHKMTTASYRSLPSADELMLRQHLPSAEAMDAELTRNVERAWLHAFENRGRK